MHDLVSVIMPTHNCAAYAAPAIQSALRQTHSNVEVLVVDDASHDGTVDVVEEAARQDARVRAVCLARNVGPARARNIAIEAARGRFIAFLDGDDLWEPAKLERQLAVLEAKGAVLSYTAYRKVDEDGWIGSALIGVPESVTYGRLLGTNVIMCSTALYDSMTFGKWLMPDIAKRQDLALWLRILRFLDSTPRFRGGRGTAGINEPLALYRVRQNSVSSNKVSAARFQWRVYRELEKLSVWQSAYYFGQYAYHGAVKYARH